MITELLLKGAIRLAFSYGIRTVATKYAKSYYLDKAPERTYSIKKDLLKVFILFNNICNYITSN